MTFLPKFTGKQWISGLISSKGNQKEHWVTDTFSSGMSEGGPKTKHWKNWSQVDEWTIYSFFFNWCASLLIFFIVLLLASELLYKVFKNIKTIRGNQCEYEALQCPLMAQEGKWRGTVIKGVSFL